MKGMPLLKCVVIATIMGAGISSHAAAVDPAAALSIAQKNNCLACHAIDAPKVGPAYRDVAKKYKGNKAAPDKLFAKVRNGGTGVWGQVGMPANPTISDADLHTVIAWVLSGAPDH